MSTDDRKALRKAAKEGRLAEAMLDRRAAMKRWVSERVELTEVTSTPSRRCICVVLDHVYSCILVS